MKKTVKIVLTVVLVLALGAGLWFYGVYTRLNNDNIPSKELLVDYYFEKGEDFATEKLKGYAQAQLKEVWGEPQAMLSGFFGEAWETDGAVITVYYEINEQTGSILVDQVKVFREE